MLTYLTLIFCCQLVGELLVSATGLPVPGPVIGMLLLFAGLLLHGSLPADLGRVADALITNLSLLFVPAGVGVMLHLQLLGSELVPISIALVVSTLITIAISGGMMLWLNRGRATARHNRGEDT
ncbi:MAG: CidA/LrgA family protein [Gammaproteobacteria bacterium]|nr:CidA/LrgA family protein [Gammaproteobacteria bacterium]